MPHLEIVTDPVESAKSAGLRYVSDAKPGITRKRWRKGFRYFDAEGTQVRELETLARIKSLVIPPAWTDVWICPNPKGHLQATGRDARGRKQSRYHPRWREVRDETKYERMMAFGAALPTIRDRVEQDLARPALPREKILGSNRASDGDHPDSGREYRVRKTKPILWIDYDAGQTCPSRRIHYHLQISGKERRATRGGYQLIDGWRRIIQRCQDIPGYELFQYVDSEGEHHTIDSADVNDYLREATGQYFTAKTFELGRVRLWPARSCMNSMCLSRRAKPRRMWWRSSKLLRRG